MAAVLPETWSFSKFRRYVWCSSMSFPNEGDELQFKKSLERPLVIRCVVTHFIGLVIWGLFSLKDGAIFGSDVKDNGTLAYVHRMAFLVGLVGISLVVLGSLWYFWGIGTCIDWEILFAFTITIEIAAHPWISPWTASKMHGDSAVDVWGTDMRGNEGNVALAIDFLSTVMCLCLPMRMRFKWIAPVFGTISFILVGVFVGSPFPKSFMHRALVMIALTSISLWGAWNNELVARNNFIAQKVVQRKSRELGVQHTSYSRILYRLTDALLHLDSDFFILETDRRFSALVLRAHQDYVTHMRFCDFLASDDDRSVFEKALKGQAATIDGSEAGEGMVNINLRDCYGRQFAVYAHHASYFQPDGECGHTVALVEVQDRDAFRAEQADFLPFDSHTDCRDDNKDQIGTHENLPSGNDHPAVWLDMSSPGFNIVQCSVDFTMFGPIPTGTPFVDLLANVADKGSIENFLHSISHSTNSSDSLNLTLRNASHSSSNFAVSCKRDTTSSPPDLGHHHLARLVFNEAHEVAVQRTLHVNHRRSSKKLALPGFTRTPMSTQEQLMGLVIKTCNADVQQSCCAKHASLRSIMKTCEKIRQSNCSHSYFADMRRQCYWCFALMRDEDAECFVCGEGAENTEESQNAVAMTISL